MINEPNNKVHPQSFCLIFKIEQNAQFLKLYLT